MPGLAPGIHVFSREIVDGRDKPGHDKIERRAEYYCVAMSEAGPTAFAPSTLRSRAKR